MPIGIELQLHDASGDPLSNETGITACWWDVDDPVEFASPLGKATNLSTDASGWLKLDLSLVSGHSAGGFGFLLLHKDDAVDYKDSLIFASKIEVASITSGDQLNLNTGWTRPEDWLALPSLSSGEQKFVGLHAVFPDDGNHIALKATGAYTVDWGDGSATEDIASGAVAQHIYSYSSISSSTDCSRGYRQAIVTVTPQAGNNLTSLDLNIRHSSVPSTGPSGFLDIAVQGEFLTSLNIFLQAGSTFASEVQPLLLEQVWIGENAIADFSYMFAGAANRSLASIPRMDTHSATDMTSCFSNCYLLRVVPPIDTSGVTSFSGMFSYCRSLSTIPAIDTSAGTDFDNMFSNCLNLITIPMIDTSSGTNFTSMFSSCNALKVVPAIDTSNGVSFASMFNSCYLLEEIPALDMSSGVGTNNSVFSSCYALKQVPALNTAGFTGMSSFFQNCVCLVEAPSLVTTNVTNANNMFYGCAALRHIPAYNFGALTSVVGVFTNCTALAKVEITNINKTVSFASCNLSAAALNDLFANLASVSGQTITITGNPGAATCDRSIATSKGWTVTG